MRSRQTPSPSKSPLATAHGWFDPVQDEYRTIPVTSLSTNQLIVAAFVKAQISCALQSVRQEPKRLLSQF
jgi:hypothetical protein